MDRSLTMKPSGASRTLKRLILAACVVGGATFGACNTTEGVGKDVKSLGRGIEESAQDAKSK